MAELMLDHKIAIKRKRKARIAAFVVLGVVFILAALIIAAACVPVNLKPSVVGSPNQITIYDGSSRYGQFSSDEEQYQKFMSKFDQMFETNYLVALFSGRLGEYKVHASPADQQNSLTNKQTLSQLETNVLKTGYYAEFSYREAQTLRNANGDFYKSTYNSSLALTFKSLYFVISDVDALTTLEIYVPVKFNTGDEATEYIIKITQKANTYLLYESLSDFERM